MSHILVTGGAGYIGSHTVLQLLQAGHQVWVLDNLYSGHQWAVTPPAKLVIGDINDDALVRSLLAEHNIDSVIHFAGHIVVPESVENPAKYYENNVVGSLRLIEACEEQGVKHFIFSSSAAVYGEAKTNPISEEALLSPINPYGTTKLMTEWTLRDMCQAPKSEMRYVALRYFNVAGADSKGRLGQSTPDATHLIKVACEAAAGKRQGMAIFGEDYDTPDGSCVRDYIHVEDLANAHVCALDYLQQGGESQAVNCGYGVGYSVKEVVQCVKKVSGVDFDVTMRDRRAGDPAQLIASNEKIKTVLGWQPKCNDLELICRHAFEWEQSYQASK